MSSKGLQFCLALDCLGEMMERQFTSQIESLRSLIVEMGGQVEKALDEATQALMQRNSTRFKVVHEIEAKINALHKDVDNSCISFMAKQGPVARDLRLVVSIIKMNTDLERMGDQCVNIAYTGEDFLSRRDGPTLNDIELMSQLVRKMVKDSLDCFVRMDEDLARDVLRLDDEVDSLKTKTFNDVSKYIRANPEKVEASLDLILIARNLERLGDHATNIAEDVIYVASGKDIRHGGDES